MSSENRRYRHHALLYDGIDEFLAAMVPFLRDGTDANEPCLVVVSRDKIQRLTAALGRAADRIEFADMHEVGCNPAHIIPVWHEFIDRHAGRAIRGIGEPVHELRSTVELAECLQHEALLNVAVDAATPLWLMCPYDTSVLGAEALHCALRTHPVVVEAGAERPSAAYDGQQLLAAVMELPLSVAPEGASIIDARGGGDAAMRRALLDAARDAGLSGERADDFALAAREAVDAAGAAAVEVRVWTDHDRLVCEVTDDGLLVDLLVGRRRPSSARIERPGLWLANHLCDLIQVRTSRAGTIVRLHMMVQPA